MRRGGGGVGLCGYGCVWFCVCAPSVPWALALTSPPPPSFHFDPTTKKGEEERGQAQEEGLLPAALPPLRHGAEEARAAAGAAGRRRAGTVKKRHVRSFMFVLGVWGSGGVVFWFVFCMFVVFRRVAVVG